METFVGVGRDNKMTVQRVNKSADLQKFMLNLELFHKYVFYTFYNQSHKLLLEIIEGTFT